MLTEPELKAGGLESRALHHHTFAKTTDAWALQRNRNVIDLSHVY